MLRVDIHCHLLPGIDDGPTSMEESVELAAAAVRDGTRTIVATPHVRDDFFTAVDELPARVREVQQRLARYSLAANVLVGGELGHGMVPRLSERELDVIAQGPPGARWLLVETPFEGLDDDFGEACSELRERGFGVVLAHPERGAGLLADGGCALRRQLDAGARLQVNVWSLAGGHGSDAQDTAGELLRAGSVAAIASDSHPGWRKPELSRGIERASACGIGRGPAARLTDTGPLELLARGVPAGAGALAA
jgi:protein-tyrosine phosphatase